MHFQERFAILGGGFIGLNLVHVLLDGGADIAVLDHNAPPADLAGRVHWVRGEFDDAQSVAKVLSGATVAFHLISSTVPGDEHVDITRELSENILSTLGFMAACERLGVNRVVFGSSSSVYGLQQAIPIAESAVTDPISSHGIQKLTIEKYMLLRRFHGALDVRIARLSNPFGPGQKLYGRQGFVAMTIGHLLRKEPVLLRDGGKPIRDFIFIDDVTTALIRLATHPNAPAVLNIGSGIGHSLCQVVEKMEEVLGHPVETVMGEARRTDIPVSVLDVSQAERSIAFRPGNSLAEGLRRTLIHHGLAIDAPGGQGK